jgi:hypothetical protein
MFAGHGEAPRSIEGDAQRFRRGIGGRIVNRQDIQRPVRFAVNDLFYLAEPFVKNLFVEDVTAWLDSCDIRYTPKVKFSGKSGYDHLFDFVIPKSRKKPERILQAINRPSKDAAKSMAFSWIDTREVRAEDATAYALLNDFEREVPASVIDALHNYGVTPVLWSKKDQARPDLAA